MFSWSLAYVISEWAIRLAMLPVVTRRRSPSGATAWLVVIFFIPWAGLFLYVLLAGRRLGKRRIERHAAVLDAMKDVDRLAVQRPHIVQPDIEPAQQQFVHLAENLGSMPILGGNDAELLTDTDEVIDRIVADIDAAQHHVHLLFYIFRDDHVGRRVTDAMVRAEARGVECRLLVDAVGSRRMLRRMTRGLRNKGVQVHGVLPVNPLRRVLSRVDLRNHRKLAVIDGSIAYTGSQNIVRPDYGHRNLVWHDLMVRLTGPVSLQLQLVFLEDWYFTTDEALDIEGLLPDINETGDVPAQVVPTGPNHPTEPLLHLVVEAIHTARQRIIITSPYMVPDQASMLALCLAARRGVQVDLVVPQRGDHPLVYYAGRSYYEDLLEAGVNIHLHQDGLLHAKTITIDDTVAMVGSANFDIRSFFLNFELNVLLYGPHVNAKLRMCQKQYIDESVALSLATWQQRSSSQQFIENIMRLLSPLL